MHSLFTAMKKKNRKWKERERKERIVPKGTPSTKAKNKWFHELSALLMCLSLYYYYFVQDDDYFSHYIKCESVHSVVWVMCMCFMKWFPGRFFCCCSWIEHTHTVCLALVFCSILRNCCASLAVLPAIVIALTIRKRI